MPLCLGRNDHRELRRLPAGLPHQPRDAQRLPARLADGDEGHLPVVVDLRHAGDLLVRQAVQRREEAEPDVLGREAAEEIPMCRRVLRPDRAQDQRVARDHHPLDPSGDGDAVFAAALHRAGVLTVERLGGAAGCGRNPGARPPDPQ